MVNKIFPNLKDPTEIPLYGTVTETADGQLLCRYNHPKAETSHDVENYLQLSVKKGKMSWVSSERYWFFGARLYVTTTLSYPTLDIQGPGQFGSSQVVRDAQANRISDSESMMGALCRVQDRV